MKIQKTCICRPFAYMAASGMTKGVISFPWLPGVSGDFYFLIKRLVAMPSEVMMITL